MTILLVGYFDCNSCVQCCVLYVQVYVYVCDINDMI